MTEQGIVKRVEGELVWISGEQCAGCGQEVHCGSCGSTPENTEHSGHPELTIFGTRRERSFAVRNSQSFALRSGDRVEYFVAPGKAIKAGFLILIAPILAFFLLYYLTGALWPEAGDTIKVLAGVSGIALGFVMNFLLRKKTRDYPEITKVVSPRR